MEMVASGEPDAAARGNHIYSLFGPVGAGQPRKLCFTQARTWFPSCPVGGGKKKKKKIEETLLQEFLVGHAH
jgi:hypothetical protein